MTVLQLGKNTNTSYEIYEETPLFIGYEELSKLNMSFYKDLIIEVSSQGLIVQAKVFELKSNLQFYINQSLKSVKSI